jgi:myo-inositol 2-dehydrogenase/D-chiro-inositol 1-dehydrogenase
MSTIRFGLIGYGAWGRHHAACIAKAPGAQLAAVAAHSESSRAAVRTDHPDARVHADYRDMLAREELDVVDIVLPSHLHADAAAAALESGRHVLLEKPMTLSVADCDALIALAERKERLLAVGHELRLSHLWGRVRSMIDAGDIGDPLYAMIELWRHPYRQGAGGWRYDIARVGNWILEEPIHFFDLARWYLHTLGEPRSVFARANSAQAGHPELQDNFSATLTFDGGAYAMISQTLLGFEHHQSAKVCGTKGALWASWSGAQGRTLTPTFWLKHFDGREVREIAIERAAGELFELQEQIDRMVSAVRDGDPLHATGADGRWSVHMCLAAQKSVESGAPQVL